MDSGGYVSDEITNQIVADRLAEADCERRLPARRLPADACPGRRPWTRRWPSAARPSTRCVSLLADEDAVVARLLKRAEIEGRADDTEETIRVRQQVYADQTAPLLEVYCARGLLVEVDGLGAIDEVSDRVFAALDELQGGAGSAEPTGDPPEPPAASQRDRAQDTRPAASACGRPAWWWPRRCGDGGVRSGPGSPPPSSTPSPPR